MRAFLSLLLVLVLVAALAGGYAWHDYNSSMEQVVNLDALTDDSINSGGEKIFEVKKGWSAKRTANELAAQSIIEKPHWFYLHARLQPQLTGQAVSIKSGEFVLSDDLTATGLFDLLVTGQSKQYQHTIIEGNTFKQMIARLADVSSLEVTGNADSAESVMSALGMDGVHPEGLFFSDTYLFPRDTSDIAFLKRAQESLDQVLKEEWEGRAPDLPYKSPYEALIMASIIEKETAVAEERPLIAGVFVSRIHKGMRLQTDPTVIYGIGDSYDGNIRRKDLRTDTPYNTYTRGGLPPTPISMVGREAIHAALHPQNTTALYFVSKGDGTHYFSETIEEHNSAVRKYQLKR